MKYGERERLTREISRKKKIPLPDVIKNKPRLLRGLDLYLDCFWRLDSDRVNAMSAGKIPFSSVLKYAGYYNFTVRQTDNLLFFIATLDDAYLNYVNNDVKKKAKK